jgi:hypothetical protein
LEDDCWVRIPLSTLRIIESSACHPNYQFKVPQRPGEIIDMVEIQKCVGGFFIGTQQSNFVLLKDNSVWVWQHTVGNLDQLAIL